ncbi:tripartite tricarboxylate transporter TctB family protein [Arthrobacter sp. BB-1]|uniref:tripartite tricarboxylate transporter TctB family protein n=1 Tax=Micrococcaceae TaxID=1268 RepID=UPI001111A2EA|nr:MULTISPECIES: tripartite tricarboxylate transporter TctB family protein [Micrococcaceae]TNB72998.1 tripartite tricarboxylate transporter TctB family protein [Arthrobacter sp. BB-1]UEL30075.1 tripartite tricarboxylate transporter TctB family protein [Pseudarthrobacter sp. L1SW]
MSSGEHTRTGHDVQQHPPFEAQDDVTLLITEHSGHTRPVSRFRDVVCTAACLLIAGIVLLQMDAITDRGSGPSALNGRFWPTMLATALIVTGTAIALVAFFKKTPAVSDQEQISVPGMLRLTAAIVLLAAYVASWGTIQFALSTAVVTGVMTYLFGGRNLTSWLYFPAGLGILFHLFFIVLLKVPIQ